MLTYLPHSQSVTDDSKELITISVYTFTNGSQLGMNMAHYSAMKRDYIK